MKYVNGDLLQCAEADWIVQQCNCLTVRAHGLAQTLFAKFPNANCYAKRRAIGQRNLAVDADRAAPGSVSLVDDKVVNMFAQWRPGSTSSKWFSSYPEFPGEKETVEAREKWFQQCLDALSLLGGERKLTIAFPFRIGCGLAGGDWDRYSAMIAAFEQKNKERITVLIVVCKSDEKEAGKRKREEGEEQEKMQKKE